MRWLNLLSFASLAVLAKSSPTAKRATPYGIDVSDYQPSIDWTTVADNGIAFAFIKATESTDYINPDFSSQYDGATNAGLIRGGYHFAHPDQSSGSAQATYFLEHGGGWSGDGITLPGALDIESNPDGSECYDLSTTEMSDWLADFSNTYYDSTGRYPIIYTTASWWDTCTGSNSGFGDNSPLWLADWASTIGALPAGWDYATFWQYADSGENPGDADLFNGDSTGLSEIAYGHTI